MVEVTKKEKENSESLIRRFSRQVQGSGKLAKARKQRFRIKKVSKRKLKKTALYKSKIRKIIDRYKKMGIFDDDKLKDIKKKMEK